VCNDRIRSIHFYTQASSRAHTEPNTTGLHRQQMTSHVPDTGELCRKGYMSSLSKRHIWGEMLTCVQQPPLWISAFWTRQSSPEKAKPWLLPSCMSSGMTKVWIQARKEKKDWQNTCQLTTYVQELFIYIYLLNTQKNRVSYHYYSILLMRKLRHGEGSVTSSESRR
jgi:hypothetical protein